MSHKAIKIFLFFLFANLIFAGAILLKNKTDLKKSNTNQTVQPLVVKTEAPIVAKTPDTVTVNAHSTTNTVTPTQVVTSANEVPVCISMGPFNIEEKGTIDFILTKNNEINMAQVEMKTPYLIYWDLGTNQEQAEKLFKAQKDGPMADQQFELAQNTKGNWVVNITKIKGSKAVVEKLTKDLGAKADKLHAGGEWKFEILKDSYYYIFSQYNKLSPTTTKNIDVLLKPKKEPC